MNAKGPLGIALVRSLLPQFRLSDVFPRGTGSISWARGSISYDVCASTVSVVGIRWTKFWSRGAEARSFPLRRRLGEFWTVSSSRKNQTTVSSLSVYFCARLGRLGVCWNWIDIFGTVELRDTGGTLTSDELLLVKPSSRRRSSADDSTRGRSSRRVAPVTSNSSSSMSKTSSSGAAERRRASQRPSQPLLQPSRSNKAGLRIESTRNVGGKSIRPGSGRNRSPGKTRMASVQPVGSQSTATATTSSNNNSNNNKTPDFITQTDRYGNASTPRSNDAIQRARIGHPTGPKPHLHVNQKGALVETDSKVEDESSPLEACAETMMDSLQILCCCDVDQAASSSNNNKSNTKKLPEPQDEDDHTESTADDTPKLLPRLHPDDAGKKCLVLDLDETLVHSSFRAVPGADFVIPVQVCVGKRWRTWN